MLKGQAGSQSSHTPTSDLSSQNLSENLVISVAADTTKMLPMPTAGKTEGVLLKILAALRRRFERTDENLIVGRVIAKTAEYNGSRDREIKDNVGLFCQNFFTSVYVPVKLMFGLSYTVISERFLNIYKR